MNIQSKCISCGDTKRLRRKYLSEDFKEQELLCTKCYTWVWQWGGKLDPGEATSNPQERNWAQ